MSLLNSAFSNARILLSVFLIAEISSASAAPNSTEDPDAGAARAQQFQTLPLQRSRQNDLLVRALINGKPALLCVDTGAPMSAISSDRLRYFGLRPNRDDAETPSEVPFNGNRYSVAIAHSLLLGSVNLVDEPLVAIDLHSSVYAARLMNETAIDGVIGADILFPTQAVLDCSAQTLIMKIDRNVRGNAPGVDFTGFQRIPIHVRGNNLYVDGNFNGKRAKLMIDTGAFRTLLHRRFVKQMNIPLRPTGIKLAGVNFAPGEVQRATIQRFSLGQVNMRSKEVGVINLEGLLHGSLLEGKPPVAGLLGADILSGHNAIIDFGTRTLYLKEIAL
ncbi:MAG: aspartyl protease family protein [Chthoniobacterales bacterium]